LILLLVVRARGQVMRITGNVFNLLVMVNCAANFILYSALSTKFRATFSRLFCACPRDPSPAGRGQCDTGPTVTFLAVGHYCLFAGTELYWFVKDKYV